MHTLLRFFSLLVTLIRFDLAGMVLSYSHPHGWRRWFLRSLSGLSILFTSKDARSRPAGVRLRLACEYLGPIFVKFGQMLSTRRDMLAPELVIELVKLQDRVPPFPSSVAITRIEKAIGEPIDAVFEVFHATPIASASIAQVHFARLKPDVSTVPLEELGQVPQQSDQAVGRAVAIKVLRPGMRVIIERDVALLRSVAWIVQKVWVDGRRLKPQEVVEEFSMYLHDELDLMREAANASALRRNFAHSTLLCVPEMIWAWCRPKVLVMEWMEGVPISQVARLADAGVDLKKLAREGVEIFFTQVFRDGLFHADMHPGNIQVSLERARFGRYIALDFGIMGTLSDFDKSYLAQNLLAFFKRDYHRVATLHIECGWVPANTRAESLEGTIRAVCEPYFDKPLKDISVGQVLLRLFQASRRFSVEIQPQLVLLQKTLLNVEALGRDLDPDLDLWNTAQPYLERWIKAQVGWRGWVQRLKYEAPQWSQMLPQIPRLLHDALAAQGQQTSRAVESRLARLEQQEKSRHTFLRGLERVVVVGAVIVFLGVAILGRWPSLPV